MKSYQLLLSAAIAISSITAMAIPSNPGLPEIVDLSPVTVATIEKAIAAKDQSEAYRIQVIKSALFIEAANLPGQDGYCGKVAKIYSVKRSVEDVNKICMNTISDPALIKDIASGALSQDEDGNQINEPFGKILSKALGMMIYLQANL